MTPDELNRTIEFLVRHQAKFSVDLQRDHEILNRAIGEMQSGFAELRSMHREMAVDRHRIVELIEIESHRLDRHDEMLAHHDEMLGRHDEMRAQQNEILARLDRILERLTRPPIN
jgi:hypothetical protein